MVREISDCRGCGASISGAEVLVQMDPMPLAGQFCGSPSEADAALKFPLTWIRCGACTLVQVSEDVDDRVLFSTYNYASSTVQGLARHFSAYAATLAERFGARGVGLLEIGCNDGVLLRQLPAEWRCVGVDPSDVARNADSASYELVSAGFSSELAKSLGAGSFDVVTGSNCLAHISDLVDVFRGVSTILRPGGEFWLEVHDLERTLADGQWDTIYHEHKVEWSVTALERCLAVFGFEKLSVERLELHGGLIRAAFRKLSVPVQAPPFSSDVERQGLATLRAAYEGRRDTPVYRRIARALERGERVSAYGASGRANVWLNQLPELAVEYVVDDSPVRAGKWLPCVAIPVVGSEKFRLDPTALCVLTAWNYAEEIKRRQADFRGEWLPSFGAG